MNEQLDELKLDTWAKFKGLSYKEWEKINPGGIVDLNNNVFDKFFTAVGKHKRADQDVVEILQISRSAGETSSISLWCC